MNYSIIFTEISFYPETSIFKENTPGTGVTLSQQGVFKSFLNILKNLLIQIKNCNI